MNRFASRARAFLFLCGILRAWSPTALADGSAEIDQPRPWHTTSFVEEAGLQGGAVFMIDFGDDGTVWLAVSDGLYRYDGYHWRRFTIDDGLPSNYVRSVLVTRGGELWVGTDHGAGVFDGERFDPRGSDGRLAGPSVRRITEDPDGTLWFSCDQWPPSDVPSGLTRLREGKWTSWHAKDGLPSDYVSDVFTDSTGDHWVLTRRGLGRIDRRDRLDRPIEVAGLRECRDYIWSMNESADGELIVGTHRWFCIRSAGRWRVRSNTAPRIGMAQSVRTADGALVACTTESHASFLEFRDGEFVPIWRSPLDTRRGVQFIAEAPDGAIWIGGPDVLARWARRGSEWRSFRDLPDPLLRAPDGAVWFGATIVSCASDENGRPFPAHPHPSPWMRPEASGCASDRAWLDGIRRGYGDGAPTRSASGILVSSTSTEAAGSG